MNPTKFQEMVREAAEGDCKRLISDAVARVNKARTDYKAALRDLKALEAGLDECYYNPHGAGLAGGD